MQQRVAGCLGLNSEEARSCGAATDFFFGGFTHCLHCQLQAQRDLVAEVNLYTALGGGWSVEDSRVQ